MPCSRTVTTGCGPKAAFEIKNGVARMRYPHRRDVAPAGEVAGLPARDSPKPYPLRCASSASKLRSILPKIGRLAAYPVYWTVKVFSLDTCNYACISKITVTECSAIDSLHK